ncbi:MAG: ion channel [Pseudomonadota bacterium]
MLRVKSEIIRRAQRRHMAAQTQSERRRHILDLFLLLILLLLVNVAVLMWFEGFSFADAAWLTLTTVTTVGYGDLVASTPVGRIATVLLIYIFGIFLLAQIAGEWIDYRFERRDKKRLGQWRWKMKDHILILNTPETHGDRYMRLLVEQIRATSTMAELPIQVFSPHFPEGLPPDVASHGVVLRAGKPEGRVNLSEADIEKARFVLLMAVDTNDPRSDSVTLDMLDQIRGYDVRGHVMAECVLEENRERFRRMGANAVIRPIRAYPELMVRALSAPGTESILEDLFVFAGNHPRRYNVAFRSRHWGMLASQIIQKGLGTPLGYIDEENKLVTNPGPERKVSGKAIFVMVADDSEADPKLLDQCIAEAVA